MKLHLTSTILSATALVAILTGCHFGGSDDPYSHVRVRSSDGKQDTSSVRMVGSSSVRSEPGKSRSSADSDTPQKAADEEDGDWQPVFKW